MGVPIKQSTIVGDPTSNWDQSSRKYHHEGNNNSYENESEFQLQMQSPVAPRGLPDSLFEEKTLQRYKEQPSLKKQQVTRN